jgi:hypothetical protein
MPNTPTTISWKTFFAGVLCGLLVGGGGFWFLYPHPSEEPTVAAGRIVGARGNALATANSEVSRDLGPSEAEAPVRVQLQPASFSRDPETTELALELKRAGWTYIMPQPKSAQARWGTPVGILQKLGLATGDYGVDGVFETLLGDFNAYQVKFRANRPPLTWRELSTFMGLSDSPNIRGRVLITNCDEMASVLLALEAKGAQPGWPEPGHGQVAVHLGSLLVLLSKGRN